MDHAHDRLGPGTGRVHCPCQHVLAGAALALDQHMGVAARSSGCLGQRGTERCRRTDHGIEIDRVRQFLCQGLKLGVG